MVKASKALELLHFAPTLARRCLRQPRLLPSAQLIQRRSRPAPPNPTVAHRHHAAHHHRLASLHLPSLLSPQTSHWHAPGEQYPYLAIARIDHHPVYLALGPHARALLRLRLIGFFHRSDSPSDARRGSRPRIRFRPRRTVLRSRLACRPRRPPSPRPPPIRLQLWSRASRCHTCDQSHRHVQSHCKCRRAPPRPIRPLLRGSRRSVRNKLPRRPPTSRIAESQPLRTRARRALSLSLPLS